jgi:hypothetical protein
MELRMPNGAPGIATWFGGATDLVHGSASGDAVIADVTGVRLEQALGALANGDIEYVALHDGEAFLQVAGESTGPYLIELHPGPPGFPVHVPTGVTADAVRYALHGFLTHDETWALPFPWEPLGDPNPPPRREGRLGRLFGRG